MSELIQRNDNRATIRWKLLSSVSAVSLLVSAYCAGATQAADDADRPMIWIELGGELTQQTGQGQPFVPTFLADNPNSTAFQPESPQRVQTPQTYIYGEEAKLTFQPSGSDWEFAAAVQIGRSSRSRSALNEGPLHAPLKGNSIEDHYNATCYCYTNIHVVTSVASAPPTVANFSTIQSRQSESHAILDFEAGKDVGVGLLGRDETSTFSVGLRMAKFVSKSSVTIHARPDLDFANYPQNIVFYHIPLYLPFNYATNFHTYGAQAHAQRSFQGVGPEIAWKDSVPFAGNADAAELTIDWGANAAFLFGRRKATAEHHQTGHYFQGNHYPSRESNYYSHYVQIARRKKVMIPNLGGFAAISLNYQNAKVSVGYKGDFFFNAMDTGWDHSRVRMIGLFGPYASISIGLGD